MCIRDRPKALIGVQTIAFRDYLDTKNDYMNAFKRVADIGYDGVQLGVGVKENAPCAKEIKEIMDEVGIVCTAMNAPFEKLEEHLDQVIADAKALDTKYIVIGASPEWVRTNGKEGFLDFAKRLNVVGEKLAAEGLYLHFHNHALEFRKMCIRDRIKRCNDFGAGGVCVASGELAESLDINLDAVPKKYEGLDGTELAISESQERMAVVLDAGDVQKFLDYAQEENLEATLVATVTPGRRLRMFWNEDCIVDISRDFLDTNGAPQQADATVTVPCGVPFFDREIEVLKNNGGDRSAAWKENLAGLNVCCLLYTSRCV